MSASRREAPDLLRAVDGIVDVRTRLMEFAASHGLQRFLQETLDEVCAVTGSAIGFYHFVEPDQKTLSLRAWSTRTMTEFCRAEPYESHYGIEGAGVWVDCIRERRPVVHNDYASLPHRRGMPAGVEGNSAVNTPSWLRSTTHRGELDTQMPPLAPHAPLVLARPLKDAMRMR